MLNQDKSILVAYLNTTMMNKEKGMVFLTQFRHYLEEKFINIKEINDDSLVTLVVPADKTEIVLLNSKYPNYDKFKNDIKDILDEYLNEKNNLDE